MRDDESLFRWVAFGVGGQPIAARYRYLSHAMAAARGGWHGAATLTWWDAEAQGARVEPIPSAITHETGVPS